MTRSAINWGMALTIIALIVVMQWLDGPDEVQTERAIAADLADAQSQAQAQAYQASEVQP